MRWRWWWCGALRVAVLALTAVAVVGAPRASPGRVHQTRLDPKGTTTLFWRVNYAARSVTFEVHTIPSATHPWIALGFSDRGDMTHADMCVLWTDWHGNLHFQNAVVAGEGRLDVTPHQDCLDFRSKVTRDVIKFTFTRVWDTCHPGHYVIQGGTTHLMWSQGEGPIYRLGGLEVGGTQDYWGMVRVQLLKPDLPVITHHQGDCEVLEVRAKDVKVPAEETMYWCTVVKLPDTFVKKHHVLEFGPVITAGNEDLVHHMEVFHCEYPPDTQVPLYEGPCHAPDRAPEVDACKRVLAAWAMGASSFVYPEEAGLPVGGPDFNLHVMLEVHYNNPSLVAGRIDSSGIALHHTEHLRSHDAAIMELGLEYTAKLAIPPRLPAFTLSGYCIPECTALGLPEGGIHIFGSQLHTHLTGARAWTKHLRQDTELPELNRDDHYSTHFQEIRRLPSPVHVLPGDALVMTCEFDTSGRDNITLGGFSISDEMCVNYVHYWPKVDLEVCKSSIDTTALNHYFDFMTRWEEQRVPGDDRWRENYQAISWTPLRAAVLHQLYDTAPLSMQCNRSSGVRFPGYWDQMPIPKALHPLPPAPPACPHTQGMLDE